VRVGEADTLRIERLSFDHVAHFGQVGYARRGKEVKVFEGCCSTPQRAKSEFGDDKRMHGDLIVGEQILHFRNRSSKVVDPDGCVREDHKVSARRRGMYSSSGMVPPRAASRSAASC